MPNLLKIQNLSISVAGKKVVKDINLAISSGQVHVIMGPNGSGKSSLALSLAGHPAYKVTAGKVTMAGKDLLSLRPDQRAKMGLFLSFQNPPAIPGVTLGQLLWPSRLKNQVKSLGLKEEILERSINEGFSGGEKKKSEILQLMNLAPKLAILDEIDSGLDVDSLRKVSRVTNKLVKNKTAMIIITHGQRILRYVRPDYVHILKEGRIIKSGQKSLAAEIEYKGYAKI